jgi:hypothetical protein
MSNGQIVSKIWAFCNTLRDDGVPINDRVKMEESINQSLQQADEFRQSTLKKAFEGKLI